MDTRSPVVLIVDDEPGVLRLAKTYLERAGYDVLAASGADEARTLCARHDGRIDALVLDIMLPGMPGLELAPELLAMRPDMKLLFMGGYPSELVVGSKRSDARFMQKPFTASVLLRHVDEMLRKKAA